MMFAVFTLMIGGWLRGVGWLTRERGFGSNSLGETRLFSWVGHMSGNSRFFGLLDLKNRGSQGVMGIND